MGDKEWQPKPGQRVREVDGTHQEFTVVEVREDKYGWDVNLQNEHGELLWLGSSWLEPIQDGVA